MSLFLCRHVHIRINRIAMELIQRPQYMFTNNRRADNIILTKSDACFLTLVSMYPNIRLHLSTIGGARIRGCVSRCVDV